MTGRISTNTYGTELKSYFYEINGRISKVYGISYVADEILDHNDYVANNDDINKGSRILSARWETVQPMKDSLVYVYLYVTSEYLYDYGYLNLEYRFTNAATVEDFQAEVF